MAEPRTLYDKIWDDHVVDRQDDGTCLLYIDRHLVHEVTSPQAFEGLRLGAAARCARRKRRSPSSITMCRRPIARRASTIPKAASRSSSSPTNAKEFGIEYFDERDTRQGIVHIIGPEQGFTLPGTTIVCGDSHTSTHGAFGALAHGIGTSEVEHVLATQTLIQSKAKNMRVHRRRHAAAKASAPRTSCSPSSARSAPPAAPAMSSNMPARRSARSRWKAA